MSISLREVIEIYIETVEGIKQQNLSAVFAQFETSFPRDPVVIAKGLEAVYGLEIEFGFVDFYKSLDDIPEERRDFLSFYEYLGKNRVSIYLNKHRIGQNTPLISDQTLRFVVLKEIFNAVIRTSMNIKGRYYPDTVEFAEFISAHLDWISERFSVYDFNNEDEYSPTVSFENAAELLALMFLVDIPQLYKARKALGIKPKKFWGIENRNRNEFDNAESKIADLKFSLFEYEKYANDYGVKIRVIVVLIKTDVILKIVDTIKKIVSDIRSIFTDFDD